MECELVKMMSPRIIYAVVVDSMVVSPAFFICQHCAEEWAKEKFIDGFNIVSLTDAQFVSDLFDKIADIKIVHDSYNAATTGALNKHEFKV